MSKWGRFVGIPFAEGSAVFSGCDCWGLVRYVYKTDFDIDLDPYSDITPRELKRVAQTMQREACADVTWRRVPPSGVEPYDVCLMRVQSSSLPAHVGVMVDRRHVLHVEKATRSCIVPTDHPLYRNRIVGYYRHRDVP